jgi:hypothetical protein
VTESRCSSYDIFWLQQQWNRRPSSRA